MFDFELCLYIFSWVCLTSSYAFTFQVEFIRFRLVSLCFELSLFGFKSHLYVWTWVSSNLNYTFIYPVESVQLWVTPLSFEFSLLSFEPHLYISCWVIFGFVLRLYISTWVCSTLSRAYVFKFIQFRAASLALLSLFEFSCTLTHILSFKFIQLQAMHLSLLSQFDFEPHPSFEVVCPRATPSFLFEFI